MKIALCTSEAVPFAKTGGLADVCGALPQEFEDLGHDVIMVLPRYAAVRTSGAVLRPVDADFDMTKIGDNIKVYFLKHDMFLREGLYGGPLGDYPDNLRRFSYFSTKALELFKKINFSPDIVHCHDWQTSLIPLYLKAAEASKKIRTLLTIHNVSYQGIFPKEQMPDTGLGWEYFSVSGLEFYDRINILKGGIEYADLVNTVSPTHAKEMQSGEFGCGLEGVLRNRKDRFSGIINGVDYKLWNPQGDSHIFKNYSGDSLQDKRVNKSKLQEVCGLARSLTRPLVGFVGRLVEQKGIDLIVSILPQLCHQGFQTVILGTGEKKYEEALTRMAQENPSLVYFGSRFDDELAHRIYAGSDLFLMPSRFEPCGIGQLISFKYGTVPVAYKTGGLADTVVDYSFKDKSGSGFLLAKYDAKGLLTAIQKGAKVFADTESWQELMKHIMRLNFSWKESAKKYVALYEKAKHLS